jgi:hypothetical protein
MSIDTSAYDQFRQGIYKYKPNVQKGIKPVIGPELTSSFVIQNTFGQFKEYLNDTQCIETNRYDPIAALSDNALLFSPITDTDFERTKLNGTIEPLTIRAVSEFSSIDSPFEAHSIKGSFGDGNTNLWLATSQIVDKSTFVEPVQIVPFIDAVDLMGDSQATAIVLPGILSTDVAILNPFVEEKLENDNKSSVFEKDASGTDMIAALNNMKPDTDSLMSSDMHSSRTGFTYTNAPQGIDSIAFGGLLRG